jgi:deleted-in-malignant-brain-tumors protein 1
VAALFFLTAQCDDGSVRLTGGPNRFEGRVEVCGEDGSWGQVCAMGWTRDDARVVCRELGHSTDNRKLIINDHPISRHMSTCFW